MIYLDKQRTIYVQRRILFILCQLLVCIATLVASYYVAGMGKDPSSLGILSILSLAALSWSIYSTFRIAGDWFTPYMLFIIGSYVFHFGQIWVISAGLPVNVGLVLTDWLNESVLISAAIYSIISINLLHLFALMVMRNRKGKVGFKPLQPTNIIDLRISKILAVSLFLLCLGPRIYIDSQLFHNALEGGYLSIYEMAPQSHLLSVLASFFNIALVSLMICFRDQKRVWRRVFLWSCAYYLISMFIIGNRGEQILTILLLMWVRHRFIQRFTKRDFVRLGTAVFVILLLSPIIAMTRMQNRMDFMKGDYFSALVGHNLLAESFGEYGSTLLTLMFAINFAPLQVPFAKGLTYLSSWLLILPGSTFMFPWVVENISTSGVLNKFGAPLGGSYIAETYFNFGWYGLCAMPVLGYAIGKFSNYLTSDRLDGSIMRAIFASSVVFGLFMFIRDQMYSISSAFNKSLDVLILYWILQWLFAGRVRRRSRDIRQPQYTDPPTEMGRYVERP